MTSNAPIKTTTRDPLPRQDWHSCATLRRETRFMKIRAIEILTAVALTFAAILAFAKGANANDILVMNAVAAKSLTATARTGAVYVSLVNHGATPDTLVGITSSSAEAAVLHQSINTDGIMTMREVIGLDVAPMQTIDMKAEGMHIMLLGLKSPLKTGETVELTLTFDKAGGVLVSAKVGDIIPIE
jgi:periplasmic copper chaperone A